MERQAEQPEAGQIARTLETAHDADVAEALNAIDHSAASRVLAALPFDLAVRAARSTSPSSITGRTSSSTCPPARRWP